MTAIGSVEKLNSVEQIQQKLLEEIPPKWRVQSVNKQAKTPFAICIPYIDSRDCQKILDNACGLGGWKDDYFEIGGKTYCKVLIKIGDEWIHRTDVGTETNVEKEKGEASDAFKRACVKFGVGRFLYSMNPIKIPAKEGFNKKWYPLNKKRDEPIYDNEILSKFINWCKQNGHVNERNWITYG